MKTTIGTLFRAAVAALPLAASSGFAADGGTLFQRLECKTCHDPARDQVATGGGPALATIAATYAGDEEALIRFLKGEAKPRVAPENYMVMETQLAMILADKPDENLRALARFILSHAASAPAAK